MNKLILWSIRCRTRVIDQDPSLGPDMCQNVLVLIFRKQDFHRVPLLSLTSKHGRHDYLLDKNYTRHPQLWMDAAIAGRLPETCRICQIVAMQLVNVEDFLSSSDEIKKVFHLVMTNYTLTKKSGILIMTHFTRT